MTLRVFLTLLPLLASAKITVNIKASATKEQASVHATGSISEVINEHDRKTFGITDSALIDQIAEFSGGKPQHVFVKSPTPWNDVYAVFNWDQVQRTLYPKRARVTDVTSEIVNLKTQALVNNSTSSVTFDGSLSEIVQDFILTDWNFEERIIVDEPIYHVVDLYEKSEPNIISKYFFSVSFRWGEVVLKTRDIKIGWNDGIHIDLAPSKGVLAKLTAKRTIVSIEVDYAAKLSGEVACNYPNKFKDHYFWAYEINEVLKANNMTTIVESKEVINLVFTMYPNVTIADIPPKDIV